MAKIVFVTGGVISSLGKGLSSASLALLMKKRGFKVTQLKMDPYLNVDPGTMSPFQHGEVFVTEDGAETDLDLGHYERFMDQNVSKGHNITSGQIYESVLAKERRGDYLGATVQVIPHVTQEIKDHILRLSIGKDILIVEVGGTVGDIESQPFLEAARQLHFDLGEGNVCYVHLTLVPFIATAGELKTKPTQHSVQELRRIGIQPDILVCRADRELEPDIKAKIALFANLHPDNVVTAPDVNNIYKLPLVLAEEGLDARIIKKLNMPKRPLKLGEWKTFLDRMDRPVDSVSIGIIGKYTEQTDSYKSLSEALIHAAAKHSLKLHIQYVDAEIFETKSFSDVESRAEILQAFDGILVPGGFGGRAVEGKIRAIEYARLKKIPYFGICLGMQLMAIEFARNVCNKKLANSAEFLKSPKGGVRVIDYMAGQRKAAKGGTMRLGSYDCTLKASSKARKAYRTGKITERHRHRLEFQNRFRGTFEKKGMVVSGWNPKYGLVEILELKDHPWFLGCQFHPEFKSRPEKAHPLFSEFVNASFQARNRSGSDRS